jgi:hypothetical protein
MNTATDRNIEPSRRWYYVAAAIALAGVVAGAALGIPHLVAFFNAFPALGEPFRSGQPTTVDLRSNDTVVIYVSPSTAGDGVSCTSDDVVTPVSDTFTFFSDGRSWAAAYEVAAITGTEGGASKLTCTDAYGEALFAIGQGKPDNAGPLRELAAALGFGLVLPCVALGAAGILIAVVLRRRNSARAATHQDTP